MRCASVSSFGYGGTNAHSVLEQASTSSRVVLSNRSAENLMSCDSDDTELFPEAHATSRCLLEKDKTMEDDLDGVVTRQTKGYSKASRVTTSLASGDSPAVVKPCHLCLLVFSARTEASCGQMIQNISQWAASAETTGIDINDLAHTLSQRRSIMNWRSIIIADSLPAFKAAAKAKGGVAVQASGDVKMNMIFTGQGSQWAGMGQDLFRNPVFRASLTKSDCILKNLGAQWSLVDEIFEDKNGSRIDESYIAQPGIVAIQIALVDLLESLGIKPNTVIGHSSGEIAAAYAAGVFQHTEALKVAFYRSIVSSYKTGAMLAVGLGENQIGPYLSSFDATKVSLACVNSGSSTTLSGDEIDIAKVEEYLNTQSIFARRLPVSTPYHSPAMSEEADVYKDLLRGLIWKSPSPEINFISTVSALGKKHDFGPLYWTENLLSKVRFSDALKHACTVDSATDVCTNQDTLHVFLEVGPHSTLSSPVHQNLSSFAPEGFRSFYAPSLIRHQSGVHNILDLCGKLFVHGYNVRLDIANSLVNRIGTFKVLSDLPPYPWDRSKTYWHESRLSEEYRTRSHPQHELLGLRIFDCSEPTWRNVIGVDGLQWLQHHKVEKLTVFPGAAYISMAIEGMYQICYDERVVSSVSDFVLTDVTFHETLIIPEPPLTTEIQLSFRPCRATMTSKGGCQKFYFHVVSLSADQTWCKHCDGQIQTVQSSLAEGFQDEIERDTTALVRWSEDTKNVSGEASTVLSSQEVYDLFSNSGNEYGSIFKMVTELQVRKSGATGFLQIPRDFCPNQQYTVHPALLDSIFQTNIPVIQDRSTPGPVVVEKLDEVAISRVTAHRPGLQMVVTANLKSREENTAFFDINTFELGGNSNASPLLMVKGCKLHRIARPQSSISEDIWREVYQPHWKVDVDFITESDIRSNPPKLVSDIDGLDAEKRLDLLNRAASYYIKKCLASLALKQNASVRGPFKHLYGWMKKYHHLRSEDTPPDYNLKESEKHTLENQLEQTGLHGELLIRTGRNLSKFLLGELDPLSKMLEQNLLYRAYAEDSLLRCNEDLSNYIKHLIFKYPSLTVLEIGAGTGSTTLSVLQALESWETSCLLRYDFTDISPGFFEPASKLLKSFLSKLQFKKLDIELDPFQQGFQSDSYDLIIASNVLHATSNLGVVLKHVRKLLKPEGRLAMIEVTAPQDYLQVTFGLLPGWWKGKLILFTLYSSVLTLLLCRRRRWSDVQSPFVDCRVAQFSTEIWIYWR